MTTSIAAMPAFARNAQRRLRRSFSAAVDRHLQVTTVEEDVGRILHMDKDDWLTLRPLGWLACWLVLHRLGQEAKRGTFVDIGCGVGRMVCAAARHGYRRTVGIEILPELAAIAQDNIGRLREPHGPCEIVSADATTWPIPDDTTVIFLYNPFAGEAMDSLLRQLRDSIARAPRQVTIAYANPVEHDRIGAAYGLTPTSRMHFSWRPTTAWRRTQAVQLYAATAEAHR